MNSVARRLLISRLLTRSGDQAWDFAVPLTLVTMPHGGLRVTALYYLAARLSVVLLAPRVGSVIDRWQRLQSARVGIGAQVLAMLAGLAGILALARVDAADDALLAPALLVVIVAAGIVSSLGSLIMDIAVANDIVPTAIPASELPRINSRLRQVDLATEVASPIVAGALLAAASAAFPLMGITLVAAWNVLSFFPEYRLIRSVVLGHEQLRIKTIGAVAALPPSLFARLTAGWRDFLKQPVMPAVVAYAFLWLSVLSPHGVLLTAYLKEGWQLPETLIGAFRGLGAIFGLVATVAYPLLERRIGYIAASRAMIVFQALCLAIAMPFFGGGEDDRLVFLGLILLSRIGLYGFSIGETQIRQVGIAPAVAGSVNGFAASVTNLATLGLYAAGVVLPDTSDFGYLVQASAAFVAVGAVVFTAWSLTRTGNRLPAP